MYATRIMRAAFRPTLRMRTPVPNEEQAAHTISQRLRRLRKIPPELIPLGVVVFFGVFAASYSSFRHFTTDKNLRLTRTNRAAEEAAYAAHKGHDDHSEH